MPRFVFISIAIVFVVLVNSTSVHAQSFLSGDWVGTFHEDQPERGPGPELGDYLAYLPSDASTLETKLARQAELRTLTRKYAADIDGVIRGLGESEAPEDRVVAEIVRERRPIR